MAAEQNRPASPQKAPDPSNSYERAHPENESGQGRLDNNKATPQQQPDRQEQAVRNKQDPARQINAEDTINPRGGEPAQEQPEHSMHDEEPDGWDQAPSDIQDNRQKRHPRTEGRGGTP
jgi:hypothetical protein